MKKIKNKIKNKKVKGVLDTKIDSYVVNKRTDLIGERCNEKCIRRYFQFWDWKNS